MIVVIYSFHVKHTKEEAFVSAWKSLTEIIYRKSGSLGSRLHKAKDATYIGYAQWPDKVTWNNANDLTESAEEIRKQLRESCEKIEMIYELEVVEDLLKIEVFTKEK